MQASSLVEVDAFAQEQQLYARNEKSSCGDAKLVIAHHCLVQLARLRFSRRPPWFRSALPFVTPWFPFPLVKLAHPRHIDIHSEHKIRAWSSGNEEMSSYSSTSIVDTSFTCASFVLILSHHRASIADHIATETRQGGEIGNWITFSLPCTTMVPPIYETECTATYTTT